jgi:tetratricopeptide (TPR) repeat protein
VEGKIGPYRIGHELGSGGMGTVYAAVTEDAAGELPSGVPVALKVLHPHLLESPGFFKRFLREAQVGRSVEHPNVVRTHDCDQLSVGGRQHLFLVMERVEGQTLRELLAELGVVPEELCRHLAREICAGLAAIHAAGAVHRDLKPENVLVTPAHEVKIMDLGVAQLAEESIRLSREGAFVGSVEYAAPEQFAGGEVDARTDLYALGLLLYEAASGTHPHRGGDFKAVMHRVCLEAPRPLGELNPQLSPFFEELVHALLARDPAQRLGSAQEVLEVLERGEASTWWRERARALRACTRKPLRRIRIPRETALYGRDHELARLRGRWELARAGEGQVVLLEGEAGIGKSRLVDELIGQLEATGEGLNFLWGSYPPGGAATTAGAFSTAFREHLGEEGSEPCLPETPLLVPAFDALLRGEPPAPEAQPLTMESIQTCFVQAIRTLAIQRPTVLLIDDLHFAPEEARALFASLALAVPGHRVLLIGAWRPGVPEDWIASLTRLEHATRLELARLGSPDLVRLLEDSLGSELLAQQLASQIATSSDGNPFFVFEILRGLREGHLLTQRDDGTWATTGVIDQVQVPASVQDLVRARVANLSEEERQMLDVAACCGFEFDPHLVGDVLGFEPIPLLTRLGQIERRHRLVRGAGVRMVFDHHQVQEALYGSLLQPLREQYHAALAQALEARTDPATADPASLPGALCVELCEHHLAGAQGDQALRYLEAARTHLERGYLQAEAVALVERALAVPDLLTGLERARTLLTLWNPLTLLCAYDRLEASGREAGDLARVAGDEALQGRAACMGGTGLSQTGRCEEAEASLHRALEIARTTGDRELESQATGGLAGVCLDQARLQEARDHLEHRLALTRELADAHKECGILANLGITLFQEGRFEAALELFEQSRDLAHDLGDRSVEVRATINLGMTCNRLGRLDEARAHLERALVVARQIGDRYAESCCHGSLGENHSSARNYDQSQEHYMRFLELAREAGHRQFEAIALVNLGFFWLRLGDIGRAGEMLEASLAICEEIGARYPEGHALLGLGQLAYEEGDTATALALVERSLHLRREIGQRDGVFWSLANLGKLRYRNGDLTGAREVLQEAVDLAQELGETANLPWVHAILANLPGGDPGPALRVLAESGETDRSPEVCLLLWQATGDLEHLREAKQCLDEALAKVPERYREAMRTNLRIHREIIAAWEAESGSTRDPGVGVETWTQG